MSNYVELDIARWEQVCFKTMRWRYVNKDDVEKDARRLQRISATEWLITDDYGGWKDYTSEAVNKEDAEMMLSVIEALYQDWLSKEIL